MKRERDMKKRIENKMEEEEEAGILHGSDSGEEESDNAV